MPGVTNRYCGIAGFALEVVDGGRMENVTIRNIKMEGYMTPIFIRHSNRHGPKGRGNTYLRNISLIVPGGGTAKDAAARVPEKDGDYPEAFMFDRKPLPAYGFYVRHADNIVFENVVVAPASPDARKPFVFDDCVDCAVKQGEGTQNKNRAAK